MIPAIQSDVWKLATEIEKIQALVTLSGLPSRETTAGDLDNAIFMIALEGVTRYGLAEAVKVIVQGALGHAFLPSPPELRIQCDKAMEWHEKQAKKVRYQENMNADWRSQNGVPVVKTEESRAIVSAAYERFQESFGAENKAQEEIERAEIRARYGMTEEVLADMKDNPLAKARMGRAS